MKAVFQDYRPEEREHWTLRIPGWLFALMFVAFYALACVIASGCESDRASIAAPVSIDNSVTRGQKLVENGPLNNLSQDDEHDVKLMLAWFRSLSPDERKDVKAYLAYMNALNGTGPSYWQDFGNWIAITTNEGTATMGRLK